MLALAYLHMCELSARYFIPNVIKIGEKLIKSLIKAILILL
jgi:hypothetical protein